ncbi:MAG TPA: twin-arginine translocation signal domain-containing protein, partial [Anseongella sp.]|nr:twin-arginine translocation signal domain-containing protein [Anseongella sp.]
MNNNRREFLKLSGLAGLGLVGAGVPGMTNAGAGPGNEDILGQVKRSRRQQRFNMSGYAAPKLETVRIGFIGLGQRGPGAVDRMSHIQGVEIKALCDIRPDRAEKVKQSLAGSGHDP